MSSTDSRSARAFIRSARAVLLTAGGVAGAGCGWRSGERIVSVSAHAGLPANPVRVNPGREACARYCKEWVDSCQLATLVVPAEPAKPGSAAASDGLPVVICELQIRGRIETWGSFGRRPRGAPDLEYAPETPAEHYRRAAYEEAAAIHAFRQLVLDLDELGAPRRLIREAARAALEEAGHARISLALARRLGGHERVRWPRVPRAARRRVAAFELAIENATAGCANELFGTWLELHQARFAPEPAQRAAARAIAIEEARHAALAFRIQAWLDGFLTETERHRVHGAMEAELARLALGPCPSPELARALGLPDAATRRRAARALALALDHGAAR